MNGYQLTFYTEQRRRHGHQSTVDWLLSQVRKLGINGATVIDAAEGVGHAGVHHAAHFIDLKDQPVQVIVALSEDEAQRLLDAVTAEKLHVFYTKFRVEYGLLGDEGSKPSH